MTVVRGATISAPLGSRQQGLLLCSLVLTIVGLQYRYDDDDVTPHRSASIISNESTDIDADAKGPSPSASAADVGTGSAAAPFTMCEEPSVLANAKKGQLKRVCFVFYKIKTKRLRMCLNGNGGRCAAFLAVCETGYPILC